MKSKNTLSWLLRLIAAVIMLQTLYFKFTAQPESIYIFSTVGMEPWGRIGTGIAELIASLLILIPRTKIFGAGLGLGIMTGAIATHLGIIGIEVQNDGGKLFILALLVFFSSAAILYLHRNEIASMLRAKHQHLP